MGAILHDSTVAVIVIVMRTRPQAIPLPMITMRKSIHGFLFPYMVIRLRLAALWAAGTPLQSAFYSHLQSAVLGLRFILTDIQAGRRGGKAAYYLEYGRHIARLHRRRHCHCHAYAPTSNTAAHDNHEKINSWVSFSLYGYKAPLGSPSGCQNSATICILLSSAVCSFESSFYTDRYTSRQERGKGGA